ncbi:MAG: tRNA 5-hydroxyuridine modification protein YegQ [Mariprofundales bacterium]|nr:tRNA 5-hydroxyuridine modification protein YegQ [Mariprofundales bacterium]
MVELLSPAGTLKNMRYAFAYGADAVYAGQPRYSLRVRNNDFQLETLQTGIDEAHALGRKLFVASNLLPHESKVKTYLRDMEPVIAMQPDALIMADPGLIMMVRERWPDMAIHLSVQANTLNSAAVRFWQSAGVSRIILSRELSLDEVAEIRQICPDIELEVFVHGALCIAYSGRCLLSGYFNHRDPNQGACTNACRWQYDIKSDEESSSGETLPAEELLQDPQPLSACGSQQRHPAAERGYLLREKSRPNELLPIMEDEHGTYIMNSRDLRAVQHVARLVEIGVDSLKIEGRTKSHYYVARTAQIYRQAVDDAVAGREFNWALMEALEGLANRGYTDGFYQRVSSAAQQNYEHGSSTLARQRFVGEVVEQRGARALIAVKNRFAVGDAMVLITPDGETPFTLTAIENGRSGEAMDVAPGSGHQVWIELPKTASSFAILVRNEEAGAAAC